jgi:O-antigen/teichoic acid export membrane protein
VKLPQSTAKRVVMNTGILYAKMGITMFISLYTTRLILNSLGASDFGIFNIVGGAIAMLGFLNAAMAGATQRFMSYAEGEGNKDKQKSIFNISLVLHFGIAVLLGIVLLGAGYFFFNGILNIPEERMYAARMIYYFMIVSTMFTVMTVPYDAVLNAHENMLYYAIVGIIESILKLAVALVVVYTLSDKLIVYGALMAAISLFVMIIMRVYCYKKYEECAFSPRKYYDKALMKEMSGFAGWNFLKTTCSVIVNYGQGIVLNIFFGTIANAAQGIAIQVNGQVNSFANTMMKALNPVLAKSEGAGNRELMIKATMFGSKLSFFLFAVLFIPVLVEMPYIFSFWLKNVPEFAVIFCRLLMIRTLIEQLYLPISSSINAHGNIKKHSYVSSIINCVPLIVSYLLFTLSYPPYYMYVIFIVYSIVDLVTKLYFARKNFSFPVSLFFKKIVFRCAVTLLIVFSLSFIPVLIMNEVFSRLFTVFIISIIFFLLFMWIVGFDAEEKLKLRQIFTSFISKK